jgi:hypothetical protein
MHCARFSGTPGENIIAGFSTGTCYELSGNILIDIHVGPHIQTQPFSWYLHNALEWALRKLRDANEIRYKYDNRRRVALLVEALCYKSKVDYQASPWGEKRGRLIWPTTSPPYVRRLPRKCRSLDDSQTYWPPRPLTRIASILPLPLTFFVSSANFRELT